MKYTPATFVANWVDRFRPNTVFRIAEADFQEFAIDIADTFGVSVANVPYYVAGTTYQEAALVRYVLPGQAESFFYALQAGKLPAPIAIADPNWKVVPGPVPATQLGQTITLAQAANINGDTVVLGRDYAIELPQASASGHQQLLSVVGIAENWFASEGYLVVNNVRTPIENIDYVAGTWTVRYSKQAIDQLLATKQDKVSTWVSEYVFFPTYTLSRSRLNQYVILTTSYGLTTITLPPVTVADAGAVIELLQAAGASSGLVRLVDTTGTLVALLQTAGALVSLRLVISGTTTRWVVVGRSNEALIPVALGAIRSLRDQGRLSPDTLYLVDDNQWGTVYVRALDVNRLAGLGDALNTATGKLEAVKLDVDAGTYGAITTGGVTPVQLATVATTLPVTAKRTADYTLQLADAGRMVRVDSSTDVTVTVPSHADAPFTYEDEATILYVQQYGTGAVTIAAANGVVVKTADGYKVPKQWEDVALHKHDLNTWVLKGGIGS